MSDHRDGGPYGYGPGQGDAQGRGHDEQAHAGPAPYPRDGAYVPEPLPSGLPPHADPGTPFGAPPPGDDWSAHTAGPDGAAHGVPASGDGWGTTPPSAHPWQAPQPPYAEGTPGYGTAAYEAAPDPGYETPPGHLTGTPPAYGTRPGQGAGPAGYDYGTGPDPGYETPPGHLTGTPPAYGTRPGQGAGPAGYDYGTGPDPGYETPPGHLTGTPPAYGTRPGQGAGPAGYDYGTPRPAYAEGTPDYGTPSGYAGPAAGHVLGHGPLGYDATGVDTGAPWQADPGGQAAPHAYAAYADAPPHAAEHTAVLPPVPAAGADDDAPRASRRGGPAPARPDGRTGSPIIPPGIQPAALTAALGLLLAGGAAVGKPALAVVLVLLQAVTAAGWFRLNGMWPARQGIVLAFLAGVTADIGMLAADGGHAPAVALGTLGVWLLLVLVLQLRHHGSADERLSSLTATSASTLITVLACGYLAAQVSDAGSDAVVAGAVAVAAATLVRALPLPGEPLSVGAALLVAAGTGALTAGDLGTGRGVLLAAAAGACALIGLRVAGYDFPSRFVHFTAGVALPLTAAAPVVYALGRALG